MHALGISFLVLFLFGHRASLLDEIVHQRWSVAGGSTLALCAKFLIKELKSFQGESRDGDYCSDKKRAMLPLVVGALSATRAYTLQANQPVPPLSIKYLFDEWDYEGTGSEDYDYFTYADETAEVKKLSKQAMALVKKLNDMGVKAELAIKHKVPTSEGHAAAYAALNTYLDGLQ